jgi:hypothetical protein
MERYCGRLQRAVKGRRYVWASIDAYALQTAQAAHIKIKYHLTPADIQLSPPTQSLLVRLSTHKLCKLLYFGVFMHH